MIAAVTRETRGFFAVGPGVDEVEFGAGVPLGVVFAEI